MNLELQDKVAIIAGGSRGIGLSIARSMGTEGCRLLLCGRSEETLQQAADSVRQTGSRVETLALDLVAPDAGKRLVAHAENVYGGVDIYVGSAGGNRRKNFEDTTDEDWTDILNINFHAHARASRALIPIMRARGGGAITFISSIFGREAGGPGLSIYNTTKSAIISLAKIMAIELGSSGIRVNSVAPGSIRYPGGSWDRRCIEDPDGMKKFVEQNLPMGRFGTAEEVADVVTFLSSNRASWVSGACITVDGVQSRSLI